MFDIAYIRKPIDDAGQLDLGSILETILYYNAVHWIVDYDTTQKIVSKIGLKGFLELLQLENLCVIFAEDYPGIRTNTNFGFQTHSPCIFRIQAHADGKKVKRREMIEEAIQKAAGAKLDSKQRKIIERHSTVQLMADLVKSRPNDSNSILELVSNPRVFKIIINHIRAVNRLRKPNIEISKFEYHASLNQGEIIVGSQPIDLLLPRTHDDTFGWGHVLAHAYEYLIDTQIAANMSIDLFGSEMTASIAAIHVNEGLGRAQNAKQVRHRFETYVFEDAGAFSEAFNSGHLTFSEAIKSIKKSRDMRDWLINVPPSADLVTEYIYAVEQSLQDKGLGKKTLKLALFAADGLELLGSGFVGAAAGGLVETFADRILNAGWRPTVFVNRIRNLAK